MGELSPVQGKGHIMAYGDGDRGVGGWLAFFLVTLGIFTPGATIILTLLSFGDPDAAFAYRMYPGLGAAVIAIAGVLVAACWFACWRFLTVFNPQTVRIGIATLIFTTLMSIVVEPMVVSAFTGIDFGTLLGVLGPEQFRPIGYATIWTLYLLLSKRVKNTYGGATEEEMTQVFQ
jgi:hypothetical protein